MLNASSETSHTHSRAAGCCRLESELRGRWSRAPRTLVTSASNWRGHLGGAAGLRREPWTWNQGILIPAPEPARAPTSSNSCGLSGFRPEDTNLLSFPASVSDTQRPNLFSFVPDELSEAEAKVPQMLGGRGISRNPWTPQAIQRKAGHNRPKTPKMQNEVQNYKESGQGGWARIEEMNRVIPASLRILTGPRELFGTLS